MSRKEKYPKKRRFVIYSTIPRGFPYYIGGGGNFIPVFDDTDHFHFACSRCREIACVVMVERRDYYANTPTIYFYLKCPKCGAEGQRKIYLEDSRLLWCLRGRVEGPPDPIRGKPAPESRE